jgi:uncharacterized protein (TIGR01777 family)
MPIIRFTSAMPAPAADVFAWHLRDGAFQRLAPPWDNVRMVSRTGDVRDGEVRLEIRKGPVRIPWVARHLDFVPGEQFVDEQASGPFARWRHTHRVHPIDASRSTLEDHIDFALPLAPLSAPALPQVRRMLGRMFAYRHAVTRADLERHAGSRPLRIAVTGASGLVGSALVPFLTTGGHDVIRLVRRPPRETDEHEWTPERGLTDPDAIGSLDAVIHLAGESVAAARWTPAVKRRIADSRVGPTRALVQSLSRLAAPPSTFIAASAIGYFGDRGDERLTEASAPGTGFLPDLCQQWEAASQDEAPSGMRVIQARLGIVIDARGGALKTMLPPFRAGVGGRLCSGRQYFSWIALEDVLGALLFLLRTPALAGPVHLTAPDPPTNAAFTKVLGRVLGRPTLFPVPAFALAALFGEMARAELLASKRVVPAALQQAGFRFLLPDLEHALRHTLGRTRPGTEAFVQA